MNKAKRQPDHAKAARRHRRVWATLRVLVKPIMHWRLGFTAEAAPDTDAPALILANHNTDYDPILLSASFRRQMYFVASEHVFRMGWLSKLIAYLVAPIPRVKGASDARAAMEIARRLRAGDSICLFAEGNRSADGITAPISPATGLLAKCGADLITYRLEGGYLTHPRWAKTVRKGRMRGRVIGHYTAAMLKAMSMDEVNAIIRRDLHEDAYATQARERIPFRGKRLAESLETVLYRCPVCGGIDTLHSEGDRLTCACGLALRYTERGYLEGDKAPFDTVAAWYAWQRAQVADWIANAPEGPILSDKGQTLYAIDDCVSATPLCTGELRMTREAISLGSYALPLETIAELSIVGQMTLTFVAGGKHYEIKSDTPRSGYKYLDAFEALTAARKA